MIEQNIAKLNNIFEPFVLCIFVAQIDPKHDGRSIEIFHFLSFLKGSYDSNTLSTFARPFFAQASKAVFLNTIFSQLFCSLLFLSSFHLALRWCWDLNPRSRAMARTVKSSTFTTRPGGFPLQEIFCLKMYSILILNLKQKGILIKLLEEC